MKKKIKKKEKPINWKKTLTKSKKQEMSKDAQRLKILIDTLYYLVHKYD